MKNGLIVIEFSHGVQFEDEKNYTAVSRILNILVLTYDEFYVKLFKEGYELVNGVGLVTPVKKINGCFYHKSIIAG